MSILKENPRQNHAHWAKRHDLKDRVVSKKPEERRGRIYLGDLEGTFRRSPIAALAEESVMVIGPAGSGKTQYLIAVIDEWRGPKVVTSVKRDIIDWTFDNEPDSQDLLYDPSGKLPGYDHAGFNPLSFCRTYQESMDMGRLLREVSQFENDKEENKEYWKGYSNNFIGPILYAVATVDEELLSDRDTDSQMELLMKIIDTSDLNTPMLLLGREIKKNEGKQEVYKDLIDGKKELGKLKDELVNSLQQSASEQEWIIRVHSVLNGDEDEYGEYGEEREKKLTLEEKHWVLASVEMSELERIQRIQELEEKKDTLTGRVLAVKQIESYKTEIFDRELEGITRTTKREIHEYDEKRHNPLGKLQVLRAIQEGEDIVDLKKTTMAYYSEALSEYKSFGWNDIDKYPAIATNGKVGKQADMLIGEGRDMNVVQEEKRKAELEIIISYLLGQSEALNMLGTVGEGVNTGDLTQIAELAQEEYIEATEGYNQSLGRLQVFEAYQAGMKTEAIREQIQVQLKSAHAEQEWVKKVDKIFDNMPQPVEEKIGNVEDNEDGNDKKMSDREEEWMVSAIFAGNEGRIGRVNLLEGQKCFFKGGVEEVDELEALGGELDPSYLGNKQKEIQDHKKAVESGLATLVGVNERSIPVGDSANEPKNSLFRIMGSVFEAYKDPAAMKSTLDPKITPENLRRTLKESGGKKGSLFLYSDLPDQEKFEPLFNLAVRLYAQFASEETHAIHTFEVQNPAPEDILLLALDELPNMAKIRNLHKLAATMRGNRIRAVAAIQDKSQLDGLYGREQANTILNNFKVKYVLSQGSDPGTHDYLAALVGNTQLEERSTSISRGAGSQGKNFSVTKSTKIAPLLSPDMARRIEDGFGVAVMGNKQPARLRVPQAYKNRDIKDRLHQSYLLRSNGNKSLDGSREVEIFKPSLDTSHVISTSKN